MSDHQTTDWRRFVIGHRDAERFPAYAFHIDRRARVPVLLAMARAMAFRANWNEPPEKIQAMWDALPLWAQDRWLGRADAAWRAAQPFVETAQVARGLRQQMEASDA